MHPEIWEATKEYFNGRAIEARAPGELSVKSPIKGCSGVGLPGDVLGYCISTMLREIKSDGKNTQT